MKKFIFIAFCLLSAVAATANDVASFANLGFSNDSRFFLFAETGQNLEKGQIYANGYLVDVVKNQFVRNGIKKAVYEGSVNAGYSDMGALFNLLAEWNHFLKPYAINHLNTGRLIYSLEPGAEAKNVLTYRDFFTKKNYEIELNQMKIENPLKSSFFISVKVTDANGNRLAKVVGMPDFQRENVSDYFIRQVIISPDNKQIVFVIAKTVIIDGETSIRYMVETLSL